MRTQFLKASTSQRCSIYVDLTKISGADAVGDLDISQDQRTFSELNVLEKEIPNVMTSFFFLFGSVRVKDYALKSYKPVIQEGLAYTCLPIDVEEDFLILPSDDRIDIRKYTTATPNGIVISMIKPGSTENVAVHFNKQNMKPVLQYSYRSDVQVDLIKRIQRLEKYDRSYVVSNATLREYLGFNR